MSTALDAVIDGASDSSVRITDLLRRTITIAHRLGAPELQAWARRELSGYADRDGTELPVYRREQVMHAQAVLTGPMGASATMNWTILEAPEKWIEDLFRVEFRQPVAELISMLEQEGEMGRPWPAAAMARWSSLAAEGKAVTIAMMALYSVKTVVQRQSIEAVLDAVRTELLQLALDLQSVAQDAGEAGGTTVDDPHVAAVVNQFFNNIHGGSATIVQGQDVEATVVQVGDVASLAKAATGLGLDQQQVAEYVATVLEAREDPEQTKLQKFAGGVRGGAIALAGGIASNVAADQLLAWARTFLGF